MLVADLVPMTLRALLAEAFQCEARTVVWDNPRHMTDAGRRCEF